MRRIIQNSTALAAILAMIVPQAGMAELRIGNDVAAEQGPVRAERMPGLAGVLGQELANGLTADDLQCASGTERPCDNADTLVTPQGVTVQVAENGSIVLAPRDHQINMMGEDGAVVPASGAAQAEAAAIEAETEAAQDAEQAADKAALAAGEVQAAADEPVSPSQDDLAAALQAAQQETVEAAPEPEPEQPEATSIGQVVDQATDAARDTAADVADSVADVAGNAAEATAAAAAGLAAALTGEQATAQVEITPPAADATLVLSDNETSQTRQQRMPRLAEVLRAEVASGLTGSDLTCETGATQPCGDGVALMTPGGVTVETDDQGRLMMAPAARQVYRVADNGTLQLRAPEEDTPETAAATEAASETEAPAAVALNDDAVADAPAIEQLVTEANTRSSGEDFESSLRDALAQSGQSLQTAPAEGGQQARGSSSDLARALILGAGAVAVGTMLNNNRQVALSTDDRVVVTRADGSQEVIKDEVALLRQPGSTVTTENFDDGSSRTIVTREDGSRVVTIRDANLRVLRRTLISADGTRTQLIDDTADVTPVDVGALPPPARPVPVTNPTSEEQLRAALAAETQANRRFTLGQIRNIPEVRALVAPVDVAAITFDTGSAAIKPDQARQLATLGKVISDAVRANPREIFMIEGHTDTVGAEAMNLALSDRRAESVALALTEYFQVPPENMVVQGYGERFLKIRAEGDIRENRRASVRRITDLLQTASN
ncbi:MAG: OmpA family protein [Paracoccus sp. (in: a-proteobacteria)]|uniref:OmpA family protein n=1 Tax=Paracoccus sp. TaxID=267 RepID=UPI0026E020E9|nr:OmpA family protein [Paracoccus sp. (in: a-proteobacteria)]MDO5632875.1 OmpA family protein [Paracoccus sp. (in: a-proteobacteria)]